jgi:threonine dehydrogenase-like Zn-dependent dehydrogenase
VNRRPDVGDGPAGSWAQRMLLTDGTDVIAMPPGATPVEAMALACAGPTVLHALERRPIRMGECVVIQGIGPVGLAALMYARLSGAARIVAIGAPDARIELVREMGLADAVLDFRTLEDEALVEAVAAHTPGGRGADLTIECAGVPEAVGVGLQLCRRGGDYLVIGQYTDAGAALIHPHAIVYRQLTIHGSWAFSGVHLQAYVASLEALVARWDLGRLVTEFPLADVGAAMRAVASGTVLKAVLAPEPA